MGLVKNTNLYHPELSYEIAGLCFKVHNELGRFKTERQYCDMFEKVLSENKIKYVREKNLKHVFAEVEVDGNIPDFIIEEKIIIDFKTKKFVTKEDYFQMKRYLEVANLLLGLVINFRSTYLKPKRILNPKHSCHSDDNS